MSYVNHVLYVTTNVLSRKSLSYVHVSPALFHHQRHKATPNSAVITHVTYFVTASFICQHPVQSPLSTYFFHIRCVTISVTSTPDSGVIMSTYHLLYVTISVTSTPDSGVIMSTCHLLYVTISVTSTPNSGVIMTTCHLLYVTISVTSTPNSGVIMSTYHLLYVTTSFTPTPDSVVIMSMYHLIRFNQI